MRDPHAVIIRPVVTEKAMRGTEGTRPTHAYTFEVERTANKIEIRQAVEKIWPVKVLHVRTQRIMGKTKRFKFRLGRRPSWKKAIVTLKEGHRIEIL